eukprot:scaffold3084_cov144-Cylindrotheca_fusiformis.AAC.3
MRLRSAPYKSALGCFALLYVVLSIFSFRSFEPDIPFTRFEEFGQTRERPTSQSLEDLSSVDYYACCGLGHRLVRMSLAAYVAKKRNYTLRCFWGWCGEQHPIEVFSYLFRPYLASEVSHVQSRGLLLPFYNEVSGFKALFREPKANKSECSCQEQKIESDLELYTSLRERFRNKDFVDSFVQDNFVGAVAIGLHVRAGNGEGGDFERKGRSIENPRDWVRNVCILIQNFLKSKNDLSKPPILYIATDTPSMIDIFRVEMIPYNIKVLDLPQQRNQDGQGVLFGEANRVNNKGDEADDYSTCLKGWTDTLTDMFILSYADVVIAGKPSSFSQTAPMSLAFGRKERKIGTPYCEVVSQSKPQEISGVTHWIEVSPTLKCYRSYIDWCCNYSTWIKFKKTGPNNHTKITSKEFVRFPNFDSIGMEKKYPGLRNRTEGCRRPGRGRAAGGLKDKCLPHTWLSTG